MRAALARGAGTVMLAGWSVVASHLDPTERACKGARINPILDERFAVLRCAQERLLQRRAELKLGGPHAREHALSDALFADLTTHLLGGGVALVERLARRDQPCGGRERARTERAFGGIANAAQQLGSFRTDDTHAVDLREEQ